MCKANILNKFIVGIVIILLVGICSCKKADYLQDGGTLINSTPLSTYDYLKSAGQFDTLLLLTDHFNLKDSLNKASTVFAFTNYAVTQFMKLKAYPSLKVLYDSVSSKILTQYMFGQPFSQDNVSINPAVYNNWAGAKAPSALSKTLQIEYINLTNSAPGFNYYLMTYTKINGVLDGSPGAPAGDQTDVIIQCQTSSIKTSSGSILHVLVNNAQINKL